MNELDGAAVSYQVVLTKADKVKPRALAAVQAQVAEAIRRRPAAYPVVLATSSERGDGIEELRDEIAAFSRQDRGPAPQSPTAWARRRHVLRLAACSRSWSSLVLSPQLRPRTFTAQKSW
jgi:putative protein kinase ArgK-like GTPase of G3E family